MLYIFICEDEEFQLNYIKKMIAEYIAQKKIDAQIVAAKKNPKDILAQLEDCYQPAVFFIDVQLDGYDMDGFGLARRLKERNSKYSIVFLTSNSHVAYKVFEYHLEILDYIVKKPEYFRQKMIDGCLMKRLDDIFGKLESLCNKSQKSCIAVSFGGKLIDIILEDIIVIQSVKEKHLTEICLYNRMITVRQPLKSIYEQLGAMFVYVNKSCIVNRHKIQELDKKERVLHLVGGFQAEVSYRELKHVEKIIKCSIQ
jgi:two-component system response regulator AgrA